MFLKTIKDLFSIKCKHPTSAIGETCFTSRMNSVDNSGQLLVQLQKCNKCGDYVCVLTTGFPDVHKIPYITSQQLDTVADLKDRGILKYKVY